ncbi:hypothetical protein M430DRAFT_15311 [Amorphotheca resinae ATCC 22711]|uniref:Uncharacterized protein n=1 Tax=Amorphotheca resinae ATCC 22711 TaxID=857342 RepID=A0A2T3BFC6_AMORE|nr:hypothetical protein M430DRAFT_15311 [Amorphotheca resinae ATCC 22711]PSS28079.1 hypothetical protein M430DRAFT_15311 [Amorphotheca resinae ATCC 22711]
MSLLLLGASLMFTSTGGQPGSRYYTMASVPFQHETATVEDLISLCSYPESANLAEIGGKFLQSNIVQISDEVLSSLALAFIRRKQTTFTRLASS